jgi:hypothetical protein
MFYYNTKYHFKLKPGSPEEGCGAILLASGVAAEELVRRQFKRYPHLQHRMFDPQLYLAGLDPQTAEGPVRKLSTYRWFGARDIPAYDSEKHGTMRDFRESYGDQLLGAWTRQLPTDLAEVGEVAGMIVDLQLELGCEAIILPSPMTDTPRRGYQAEVRWLDAGLEACRVRRVSLPIYATIAIADFILRDTNPDRDTFLQSIAGHIASRERLTGAYIVFEQSDLQRVDATSSDTLLALLTLIDDLTRGAGRQVIVNYMGTFGALATAAGASLWGTGYYPSQRKLKRADFDDKEAYAYPRYYSLRLLGDIGLKDDLLRICELGFGKRLLPRTASASDLHAALQRGAAPDTLPLWEYKPGNHALAMPHYYECMYTLGRHLDSLTQPERINFVQKLLETAATLADELKELRPKLSQRTEITHQGAWLSAFRTWRNQTDR